jgi:hypothetical protein
MSDTVLNFKCVVLGVIDREYGALRHASKILGRHARVSHRTAEEWISGRSVPSGDNLINLMAQCEALADEITKLVAERRSAKGK